MKGKCKKGWSSSTLTKISSIGLLSVNWDIPEKRCGLTTYFFEKTTGISRFVISPLKFWNKASSLEILQNCMTLLGIKPNALWFFSWLPLKVLVIYYLTPGNSTCSFFNIPKKIQVLEQPISGLHLIRQTIDLEVLGRITLSISFLE